MKHDNFVVCIAKISSRVYHITETSMICNIRIAERILNDMLATIKVNCATCFVLGFFGVPNDTQINILRLVCKPILICNSYRHCIVKRFIDKVCNQNGFIIDTYAAVESIALQNLRWKQFTKIRGGGSFFQRVFYQRFNVCYAVVEMIDNRDCCHNNKAQASRHSSPTGMAGF